METRAPLRVVGVMHHRTTSPGSVARALGRRGLALEVVRPRYGDALPLDVDAGIVFGGTMGVGCGEAWMADEVAWAAAMAAAGTPLLGICLGAQVIAKALGGRVGPRPDGAQERGYRAIAPTPAGADMPRAVFQFHSEGFDLPPGATLLASGDLFPVQAFAKGSACGLQFHPEVDEAILRDWTERRDLDLAMGCLGRRRRNERDMARRQPGVARWFDAFLGERLLREVRSPRVAEAGRASAGGRWWARGLAPMTGQPAFGAVALTHAS